MTVTEIVQILRKHWIAGVLALLVALGVTGGLVATSTPQYTASTTAIATSSSGQAQTSTSDSASGMTSIATRLATVPAVLQPVIDRLGLNTSVDALASQVSAVADANGFITISATSSNPKQAADIANTVYTSLTRQIADDSFASDKTGVLATLRLSVIKQAETPGKPSAPNVTKMWFIGLLAGIVLGFLAVIVAEFSDKKIRREEDVQRTVGAPVVVSVPKTSVFKGSAPVVVSNPAGRAAETIRRLALNLVFISPDRAAMPNVTVVTSAGPNEGKTTIATNLAAAIVESGKRVLLIDTDLRKPSVANMLDINGKVGLAHVLAGQASLDETVQRYWKPNFHVLPAGEQHGNPSILINSQAMEKLLAAASQQYDNVIVDSTPMSVANDAAVFARQGCTLLMVVGQGTGLKKLLRDTAREFAMINVAPAGAVFNMVKETRLAKKDYYYKYSDEKSEKRHGKASRAAKSGAAEATGASDEPRER